MNPTEYHRLKEGIEREYKTKVDALHVLFPEFVENESKGMKKMRFGKKSEDPRPAQPSSSDPEETEKAKCDIPGCGKKLRSDSKKCGPCSKRVCAKHWNRGLDICSECNALPQR